VVPNAFGGACTDLTGGNGDDDNVESVIDDMIVRSNTPDDRFFTSALSSCSTARPPLTASIPTLAWRNGPVSTTLLFTTTGTEDDDDVTCNLCLRKLYVRVI
jgi:hypothetical protein